MNKLEIYNKILAGFQKNPINIFVAGAEQIDSLSYLLEYIATYGGKITISDSKVEPLKAARNIFENLLGKHDINFYLGPAENFITSEWNFIFLDIKDEGELQRSFEKINLDQSVTLINLEKRKLPSQTIPAVTFESIYSVLFVPGQNGKPEPVVKRQAIINEKPPEPVNEVSENKYLKYFKETQSARDFVFNKVLSSFQNKPIKVLEIGVTRRLEIEGKNTVKDGDGCSTMFWADYISKFGGSLTCIDISSKAILACRELLKGFTNVDKELLTGDGLDFIDESYDLIYLDGGDDPAQTLKQFEKINNSKTKVLVDDFQVKGVFLKEKYSGFELFDVTDKHKMIFFDLETKNLLYNKVQDYSFYYINDINTTKKLEFNEIGGEKMVITVIYGPNRDHEVLEWHKRVMTHLGMRCNYMGFEFPNISHGAALDVLVQASKKMTDLDYWMFLDSDCIPMRKDYLNLVYDKVKDKVTLFSAIGAANHIISPSGTSDPYGYGSGMCISKVLWQKLGEPSFDEEPQKFDTAQRITFEVQKQGFNFCAMWPKSVEGMTFEECDLLGVDRKHAKSAVGSFHFGFSTVFGDNWLYHTMNCGSPRHKSEFIKMASKIIENT